LPYWQKKEVEKVAGRSKKFCAASPMRRDGARRKNHPQEGRKGSMTWSKRKEGILKGLGGART